MSDKLELVSEKDYQLLARVNSFDSKGDVVKVDKVNMKCLKIVDADSFMNLIDSNKAEAIGFLCKKEYITPKLMTDSIDFRVAMDLLGEYSSTFLDLSPFTKTK